MSLSSPVSITSVLSTYPVEEIETLCNPFFKITMEEESAFALPSIVNENDGTSRFMRCQLCEGERRRDVKYVTRASS